MKITFLAHSGFLVEWERFYSLFDFWHGELPPLDPKKPLLVFASHSHNDHFDPRIFTLPAQYPTTRYFLSHDISLAARKRAALGVTDDILARVTQLRANVFTETEVAGEELSLRTFHSTDEGVAFLLTAEGRMVYHAGDNNCWYWEDEGKAYCHNMAANYRRSIAALAAAVRDEAEDRGVAPVLDVAMAPLDPRLESTYAMGVEQLLRTVAVKKLFPMHLWGKFEWIGRYRAEHPQQAEQIVPVTRDGESFEIE